MLQDVGCDALKIASGDATHHRLIATAARTGLPLIVSTGMCSLEDVRAALDCAREHGAREIAVLHCVSAYPTPAASANLGAITTLAREFGVVVGLSDHGTDPLAPALAVALGAALYERHFVIAGEDAAIDRAVSSTADEFADVVRVAARAQRLLGDGRKRCLPVEAANLTPSRRGVYASRDLAAGAVLEDADLQMLRPLTDLPAHRWRELIGRRLRTSPCRRRGRSQSRLWTRRWGSEPPDADTQHPGHRRLAPGPAGAGAQARPRRIGDRRPGDRDRREPLVAGRARRGSCLCRADVRRPGLRRRHRRHLRRPKPSAWSFPRSTTSCRSSRRPSSRFADRGVFVAVSTPDATTACNDKLADLHSAARRRGQLRPRRTCPAGLPEDRPSRSSSSQGSGAAPSGHSGSSRRGTSTSSSTTSRQPVVQEYPGRPGVHPRRVLRQGGHPISVVPRERVVIRAGVMDRGAPAATPR